MAFKTVLKRMEEDGLDELEDELTEPEKKRFKAVYEKRRKDRRVKKL